MCPVLNVTIIVKANLCSLNIKFENRYSLSASQDYNRIRLRTKPQMGFTMKGYLTGQLLCSLVSQDFQTLQMEGIPPQLQHSQGLTAHWRMDPGNFSAYALEFSTPQKSGLDSLNVRVCCMYRGKEVNQMSLAKILSIWYSSEALNSPADWSIY